MYEAAACIYEWLCSFVVAFCIDFWLTLTNLLFLHFCCLSLPLLFHFVTSFIVCVFAQPWEWTYLILSILMLLFVVMVFFLQFLIASLFPFPNFLFVYYGFFLKFLFFFLVTIGDSYYYYGQHPSCCDILLVLISSFDAISIGEVFVGIFEVKCHFLSFWKLMDNLSFELLANLVCPIEKRSAGPMPEGEQAARVCGVTYTIDDDLE